MKQFGFSLIFMFLAFTVIAQPQPLQFLDVENFKIQQVANGKATISVDIRMYNPNKYKIKLKDGDIDVFINDTRLGKVQMAQKFEVPRDDTCLIPVLLDVDMKDVLPNALQLVLSNGIADVKLSGTVKAGRHGIFIPIPINYEGKQDIGSMLKLQ